jgi:ABC-type spermidine/putrescine transport system permease subunit I
MDFALNKGVIAGAHAVFIFILAAVAIPARVANVSPNAHRHLGAKPAG